MNKETQNKIAGGLNGLLNLTPTAQAKTPTAAPVPQPSGVKDPKTNAEAQAKPKQAARYKTVCYNLDADLIEAVREYAYNEHKKLNAVVTEALEKLIKGGTI